jgi:hypothetical protein
LEIPVNIFRAASSGEFSIGQRSTADPPAAYCRVSDESGLMFSFSTLTAGVNRSCTSKI